jgi:hypothetical protein
VQTYNGGGKPTKPERSDSITFTFTAQVTPSRVLAGWDGSATPVTVHFQNSKKNDVLSVRDASTGADVATFGSVQLMGDYSATADFSGSTMTASGTTVTITLGTVKGPVKDKAKKAAMVWTAPGGTVTETGTLDTEF